MTADKTKRNNRKDQRPARNPSSKRPLRWLRAILVLAAIVLVLGLYLTILGIPRPLVRKLEERASQYGHHVSLHAVRWDVLDGIVVEGFKLFPYNDAACPCVEADRLALDFNPLAWCKKRIGLRGARIRGGIFRSHAGGGFETLVAPDSDENIMLSDIRGHLRIEPGGLAIDEVTALLMGVRLYGSGYIERPDEELEGSLVQAWLSLFQTKSEEGELPDWIVPLVQNLNSMEFGVEPEGTIEFHLHPLDVDSNEIKITAEGQKTLIRGQKLDGWRVELRLRGHKLDLPVVELVQGRKKVRVIGDFNFETEQLAGNIYTTLAPDTFHALMPAALCTTLERKGLFPTGDVEAELSVGPAVSREALSHLKGWVTLRKGTFKGIWFEECKAFIERRGDRLEIRDIEGLVGTGKQRGSLSCEVEVDIKSGQFSGTAHTSFEPIAAVPALSEEQAVVIKELAFAEEPPTADVRFSGVAGDPSSVAFNAHLKGTNFSFRGPLLASFESDMIYTNRSLSFESMVVQREEGRATGRVTMIFSNDVVDVDLISSIHPKAIGQIIGPEVSKLLDRFAFDGRTHISAKGRIDYKERIDMDIQAVVNAEEMMLEWVSLDRCSFKFIGKGNAFEIRDAKGVAYGGEFEGEGLVHPEGSTTNYRFGVRASYTNLNFREIMEDVKGLAESDPYRGRADGHIKMGGLIEKGQRDTITGIGHVRIREGSLLQVPLLGGLSRFLSRLYPGLGFIAQTDLESDFNIAECEVRLKDAKLEGNVIRVTGGGRYRFDTRLDINVRVQLLRESTVAKVLNIITYPITKIFMEFHLGGNVEDPRWRPVNLPKEMYLIFD